MAVTGHYMAWRVSVSAVPYVRLYGECIFRDVLPTFSNLETRANKIANTEFERIGSEPATQDCDEDMAVAAEIAEQKCQAFYETMTALRQTTLNLFAAGLFHLIEQYLADLCHDGAFTVEPPNVTKLDIVANWYSKHFDLDLCSLAEWPKIDELRLVANTIKHGEGASANRLRERRPELFSDPFLQEIDFEGDAPLPPLHPIRLPLAGNDIYITKEHLHEYSQVANEFFGKIVEHFETHGPEYYPHSA